MHAHLLAVISSTQCMYPCTYCTSTLLQRTSSLPQLLSHPNETSSFPHPHPSVTDATVITNCPVPRSHRCLVRQALHSPSFPFLVSLLLPRTTMLYSHRPSRTSKHNTHAHSQTHRVIPSQLTTSLPVTQFDHPLLCRVSTLPNKAINLPQLMA